MRAAFYTEAIPKTDNTRVAIASVFGVIRNCSVPYSGISTRANQYLLHKVEIGIRPEKLSVFLRNSFNAQYLLGELEGS